MIIGPSNIVPGLFSRICEYPSKHVPSKWMVKQPVALIVDNRRYITSCSENKTRLLKDCSL